MGDASGWLSELDSKLCLSVEAIPSGAKSGARGRISGSPGVRMEQVRLQKGLAFERDWSGTVAEAGPHERPGILPRRLVGRGGASVMRRNAAINRMEDSDAKIFKEAFA